MYGAMREHAPQSTRLAGAITAATATLAFGYAMANGMGAYIASNLPDPIIYVPLQDEKLVDRPPPAVTDLDTQPDVISIVQPLFTPPTFTAEDTPIRVVVSTEPRRDTGPTAPVPPTPPSAIRTTPKLIPAPSPVYPPVDARLKHQGATSLEVCLDPRGSVTSVLLASSSGYASLDQAALKWVRDRKFTPAKLDGQPQAICGHPITYEWRLDLR